MNEKVLSFVTDCGSFLGKMHAEVDVYENRIEISRETRWKVEKNTILYFEDITAIKHKDTGGMFCSEQWISFTVPGVNPGYVRTAEMGKMYIDVGGEQTPFTDENSIIFRKDNPNVKEYYQIMQEAFGKYKDKTNNSNSTVIVQETAMDKLKKLKELFDMGIIDQTEYESKKRKLLDEI